MGNDLTHDRLIGELAAALGGHSDGQRSPDDLDAAAGLIRNDREGVRALLDTIRSDRALAGEVARRSYWHSNGFAKLVLHADDPHFRLRLHVWPGHGGPGTRGGPAAGEENVHSHRWPFASVVLCGKIRVEEYVAAPDAGAGDDIYDQYRYATVKHGLVGRLEPLGRCVLRQSRSVMYGLGEQHGCHPDVLHNVSPQSAPTATVLVQGPATDRAALVYQRAGLRPLEDTGSGVSGEDVRRLVSITIGAMDEGG